MCLRDGVRSHHVSPGPVETQRRDGELFKPPSPDSVPRPPSLAPDSMMREDEPRERSKAARTVYLLISCSFTRPRDL